MGDYSDVRVMFADSDFDPEEREFMARLWQGYFEPQRAIDWAEPGAYQARENLRRQVHADLRIPGSDRDWQFILSREVDGLRYFAPLQSLSPIMIPPFPRRFANVPGLRHKYGIHATWYAMFSAPDRQADNYGFVTSIGAAREQFADNFRGLWQLIYCDQGGPGLDALGKEAPQESDGWKNLLKVFDRFPFDHYLKTLELLAGDWGRDALVVLDYAAILYNYDKDIEKAAAMVQAERDSVTRVFDALGRLDPGSLSGETILSSERHGYSTGGASPWLEAYGHTREVEKVSRYLCGD